MQMALKLAYNMLKVASIFSLDSAGWGDVLSPSITFEKRDPWKGKVNFMELN